MRKKTFLYGVLILILVLSGTVLALAANQGETPQNTQGAASSGEVYLYTGSPLVLSGNEVKMLDPTNPDLTATVINSRTLLPMRAISEYFGAEVTYDKAKKEATITYGGKQFILPVTQSMIQDGRAMVPLRVICENVLGKKVSYYDRVIAVADHEVDLKANAKLMTDVKAKIGEAVKAGSIGALEKALAAAETYRYGVTGGAPVDDAAPVAKVQNESAQSAEASGSADAASYSTTNVQVEGIDEADIVKTDGKYIYIAGNNVVRIVGADKGKLSDSTAIRLATDKNVSEIYVDGNKLVILGTRWENNGPILYREGPAVDYKAAPDSAVQAEPVADQKSISIMPPYKPARSFSFADVYDISDPQRPVFLKGHEMEGSYQSSRKNGDIVYLVTNSYPSGGIVLPMMKDTTVSNTEFSMKIGDVMIMPGHPCPGYLIISAINVSNGDKTEVEAITAYGAAMYMNDSTMYLAFNDTGASTSIIKFKLEGMKVGYAGSGDVPGYLLNQFSMDEYQGNLRVATTVWEKNSNSLYILDPSLNIMGSVENLAKGETIYSVRFIKDNGYVVTYRTMDPLFVFDLSDPKKPVLTGELEVPGFSSYLHPIGDDLLLGIGADTYDIYRKDSSGKDVVIGTRQGGIKFSLFDISDKGKPKEISKYVVGDSGTWSEALNNHKAIMIDPAKENAAIDAYIGYESGQKAGGQGAVVMGYENKKLTLKGILESKSSGVYGNDIPYARRILYIGDELYYVQDGRITSYHYDNLKEIDSLVLQ